MQQNEQLEEILKKAAVKQAAAHIKFNPAYSDFDKDVILQHYFQEGLTKAGGKLVIKDGEVRLVNAANPEQPLVNEHGRELSISSIVNQSLEKAGKTVHTSSRPQSLSTEPVRDAEGNITYTDAWGNKRFKQAGTNSEYIYHQPQPNPYAGMDTHEAYKARIKHLRDEALNMD